MQVFGLVAKPSERFNDFPAQSDPPQREDGHSGFRIQAPKRKLNIGETAPANIILE